MSTNRSVLLVAVALAAFPAIARAQGSGELIVVSGQASAAGSTPAPGADAAAAAAAPPNEIHGEPIVITATPVARVVPYGAAMYPPGAYSRYAQPAPYVPPVPPRDTPAMVTASWQRRFVLGGTVGAGSPLGVLGAFFEWHPSAYFGFTVGAGVGGTFGPALAFGGYVRPIRWGRWAPYGSVGVSANFTPGRYGNDPQVAPYMSAPATSIWLNAELGIEYRSPRGVLFRVGAGPTLLANTADFVNRDFGGRYGPIAQPTTIGNDPISASDAHDRGELLAFPYIHLDLGYNFN